MKPGAGKRKGGAFEREICKRLSLWVSRGERSDLFWRSAMSGGRATVARGTVRQCGDVCSVSPEGHSLTDQYYIECKHMRPASMQLHRFLLGEGALVGIWQHTCRRAGDYYLDPMLIVRQNNMPVLVLVFHPALHDRVRDQPVPLAYVFTEPPCVVYRMNDVLAVPYTTPVPAVRGERSPAPMSDTGQARKPAPRSPEGQETASGRVRIRRSVVGENGS